MCDQDRISLYTINTISSRQVMKIKKILIRGLLVDPIPNSQNLNITRTIWQAVRKITNEILGVKGLNT